MNNSDKRIKEIAKEATVSECFLLDFINSPIKYLLWSGFYWSHIDTQRNSQSKLLDKWMDSALAKYFKTHKDPLENKVSFLEFEKNHTVEDIAVQHIHNKFLLRLDISKYFETISFDMVKDKLPESLMFLIEPIYFDNNNRLRRGLHASPRIAEIVGKKIDNKIKNILFHNNLTPLIKYTRYCDDLQFSCSNRGILRNVETLIRQEMENIGLAINENKTKIIPVNSNQILGLRIHNGKIIVPKKYRNKARARVFIAKKSYHKCDRESKNGLLGAIKKIESAIGTLNYLGQHDNNEKYKEVIEDLVSKMNELRQTYDKLTSNSNPLINTKL